MEQKEKEKILLIIKQNTTPYYSLRDGKRITDEEIWAEISPIIEAERTKILLEAERLFAEGIDNFYISRSDWQKLKQEVNNGE